jgi:glycosyltransferase involved in cell wall biosynthesis
MICCVLPTNYNTGYTTLQESIGLGLPVIATRNPYFGIDIEKSKLGYLFDYHDAQGLRSILDKIGRDDMLINSMKSSIVKFTLDEWNMDLFVLDLVNVFNSLNAKN